MEILLLAMDIAMLTYVIGVLILALPIPLRTVKRWGPRLIVDAIAAVILASSATLILYLGDELLRIIGADWPSFYAWLSARTAALGGVFAGLSYAASFVKSTEYSYLSSPLKMAASFLATSFSALRGLYLLSSFIYIYRDKLTSIGILLYSLPFRVGKGVGAFFIAASLVMYVGMPLLPAFVSSFENVTVASGFKWNSETIRIQVTDTLGNPVPYPVLNFYSENSLGKPVGVIIGDEAGRAIIGDGLDALPDNFKLNVKVLFMGYIITPSPSVIKHGDSNVKLVLKSLVYSSGAALLIPWGTEIMYYNVTLGRISVDLYTDTGFTAYLTIVTGANVSAIMLDGNTLTCNFTERSWAGILMKDCMFPIPSGEHNITVKYTPSFYAKPSVNEKRITYLSSIFDIITGILTLCISFLYALVFLPGVYLAILLAMSAALARVLGGGLKLKLV